MNMKFNLTESEREAILNQHKAKGYGQPINEQVGALDMRPYYSKDQDPEKSTYYARHGNDPMGWSEPGGINSNLEFGDDYDTETYDDFDSLHAAYPEFYRNYVGKTPDYKLKQYPDDMTPDIARDIDAHNKSVYDSQIDRARKMFDIYKKQHGPLNIKRRRMDEADMRSRYDVQGNAQQMYDIAKNQLKRAMYELVESIEKGDKEMQMHMVMALRNITRRMDEAVQDMNS